MLGRLFGGTSSGYSVDGFARDSLIDEEYTRGLLFPPWSSSQDRSPHPGQLRAGRVGDYDEWGGLDLDDTKDFRVILAQDALGDSEEPCVLFDTQPAPPCESAATSSKFGTSQLSSHSRGNSIAANIKSPASPFFSPGHQSMLSNGSTTPTLHHVRQRSSTFSGSSDEFDIRSNRGVEIKDDTRNILNCAFGNAAGVSFGTKMHILSAGFGTGQIMLNSPASPARAANLSPGYFRRREPITRASTLGISGSRLSYHERSDLSSGHRSKSGDAVLITKLFSANLPEPREAPDFQSPQGTPLAKDVPKSPHNFQSSPSGKPRKPRAKKTPVYAVILVIQLPSTVSPNARPRSHGVLNTSATLRSNQSFTSTISRHNDHIGPQSCINLTEPGDPGISAIVERWDIVERALYLLESVAFPKLLRQLEQVDSFTAALVMKPSKPKEKTVQRTNQINIYLLPLALSGDTELKDIALQISSRIRRALRIPKVTIGDMRWGLWNDELIRTANSFSRTQHSGFLANLLTSFLGSNVSDWASLVSDTQLSRQCTQQQQEDDDDGSIHTRTVIISQDRSIARRLIYLLCRFLCTEDHESQPGHSRRGRGSCVPARNDYASNNSLASGYTTMHRDLSPNLNHQMALESPKRGLGISQGSPSRHSDNMSIRSIPIPNSDLNVRKSSTVTTSTVAPESSVPVPQFASGPAPGAQSSQASSGASATLSRIWLNTNRDGGSSTVSTRWGSLLSGFWSKESLADESDTTIASAASSFRARQGTRFERRAASSVNEGGFPHISPPQPLVSEATPSMESLLSNLLPNKLHVNPDVGVIDVDIGLPGFLGSSTDSGIVSSPIMDRVRSMPSVASFGSIRSHRQHPLPFEGRPRHRLAGLLPKFHPDYHLQAVRCSRFDLPALKKEIKNAMLYEPCLEDLPTNGWVDVSNTVIANVQTGSIKRLRLRRKISHTPQQGNCTCQPDSARTKVAFGEETPQQSVVNGCSTVREVAFSEDDITTSEPLITNALQSILARSSNHLSRNESPSRQPRTDESFGGNQTSAEAAHTSPLLGSGRVPNGTVPGSFPANMILRALDDVVRSVNATCPEDQKVQDGDMATGKRVRDQPVNAPSHNVLREGIRDLLQGIELTAAS